MWKLLVILSATVLNAALGANILFVTVLPSPSHHIWHETIVEGLLRNGHNVTLIGHGKPAIKSANYTMLQIEIEDLLSDESKAEILDSFQQPFLLAQIEMWKFTVDLAKHDLDSPILTRLMEYPADSFDVIVYDMIVPHLLPLADHFGKIPIVGTSPYGSNPILAESFGHHFYTYFPNSALPYTDDMTFFQRVQNYIYYLTILGGKRWYADSIHKIMKERFGEDIPPVADYENRVGLLLTNYDPLLDFPEPVPPQIIPVGGVNARPPKELPQDLQEILDNSKDGVIFFSLGTNVDLSFSSRDTKNKFLNAFSKLKETVLWKYTGDDLVGASKNVIIRKWYPQNDILAHKNVKIFITHNGALSTHEAMYHGVPTVGIPLFMDQINNAKKMESKGLGKSIDFHKFTSEKLYRAIEEVLQNPKYKENMQKLSRQFKDRLETPLERAVFWIEYTLRHKDVSNLSTKGRYMSVYRRENLDVVTVLGLSVFIVIYVLIYVSKWFANKAIFRRDKKMKQH